MAQGDETKAGSEASEASPVDPATQTEAGPAAPGLSDKELTETYIQGTIPDQPASELPHGGAKPAAGSASEASATETAASSTAPPSADETPRPEKTRSTPGRSKQLAVVTGASTGIGYELARCCAENGFDLLIAADEPQIEEAAAELRRCGAEVTTVEADLATEEGLDRLVEALEREGRPVDALLANAGRGLGRGFLDQEWDEECRVIDTNVTGTLRLIHRVGRDMRSRGSGRILITGSIAGFTPGTFQAVYSASKAFLNSFSIALRHELQGSGVTVTCLMPGATETEFFERAGMMDTKIGTEGKDDPAFVARQGFEAMMRGTSDVVTGWRNKLQSSMANVLPSDVTAEMHRKEAAPGTAHQGHGNGSSGRIVAGVLIGGLAALSAVTFSRLSRSNP